jgi:PPOX class probable F420-dependent enzyme
MKAPQQAVEFLSEPNICVLATTGPGDAPHAMPMWYLYDEGDILFASYRKSQKVRNVERTGMATVVIDRRDPPYYAVMVKGSAVVEPALSREKMYAMVSRYIGEERAQRYMADHDDSDSVAIRVRPERFVEFHGSAERIGQV